MQYGNGNAYFYLLATNKFPKVQNAAIELNIEPRLFLGWNSAK